ncbi:hypothetical protein BUALT_Bualt13G0073900 [Buddleja alternifolia]|uniref:FAR1 domain-containing protein n=1 Tax=Buddleja alternifolia TaxID=168488 RepID=A0AAV6WWC5_9LAMI|nr:hypothetical protein BUALT_Bualt13G0073900 [Buddleja alternifolia]
MLIDMPNSSYGIENSGDIICLESEDDDIVCPRPTEDEEVHRDEIPLDSDIAETEKKLSVYVAQSEDEAYALYQDYANLVGFSVRKGKQYYINGTKIIRSKSYLCSKEGVKDERPRSNGTRKRHTSRTHSKKAFIFTERIVQRTKSGTFIEWDEEFRLSYLWLSLNELAREGEESLTLLICINGKCNDDPKVGSHTCNGGGGGGAPPSPSGGNCQQSGTFYCKGKAYPKYTCSPPISSSTPAKLTWNDFSEGGNGGAQSECDNKYHQNSESVVALSTGWYNGGSRCGQMIRITARNGRSTTAKMVDECDSRNGCDSEHDGQPPCDNNIVDGSDAVWKALGLDVDIGVVPVTWQTAVISIKEDKPIFISYYTQRSWVLILESGSRINFDLGAVNQSCEWVEKVMPELQNWKSVAVLAIMPPATNGLIVPAQEWLEYMLTEDDGASLLSADDDIKFEIGQCVNLLLSRVINLKDFFSCSQESITKAWKIDSFQAYLVDLLWASQIVIKMEIPSAFINTWVKIRLRIVQSGELGEPRTSSWKFELLKFTSPSVGCFWFYGCLLLFLAIPAITFDESSGKVLIDPILGAGHARAFGQMKLLLCLLSLIEKNFEMVHCI